MVWASHVRRERRASVVGRAASEGSGVAPSRAVEQSGRHETRTCWLHEVRGQAGVCKQL